MTRPESASTKTIPSLANTASSGFSSILFVTNQSGTNFNAARQASTALAHISGALYQGHILGKRVLQKQIYHTFLESYIDKEQIDFRRISIDSFFTHFLRLIAIGDKF